MNLKIDYNHMMADFIGDKGVSLGEINALSPKFQAAHEAMVTKRGLGKMDFRDLPHNQEGIVQDILAYRDAMKDEVDAFIVLGIGGSALGPMAVQQAINHPYYNELPRSARNGFPRFYVADNVDPERLTYLFQIVDPCKCLFNVVSKSGSTSETMSQFMYIQHLLESKLGKEGARRRIVCTTDEKNGNLIKIAKEEGYKTYFIPSGVGGRFSQLTPVGLLPAAFCGIDIRALLEGAAVMDDLCKNAEIEKNPAYIYAVLHFILMQKGVNISVMMPYADSLRYMSDWHAQLWAESLGKRFDNAGNEVFVGQTSVKAMGVTDQHSQVQLYTEGPFDKIIVLLGVDNYRETLTIPKTYQDVGSLGFLGGITHNKLIQVEQMATEYALLQAKRPSMTITFDKVDEHSVGQLLYMLEVATAYAGELLDINAFDQPGVEEGKNATYAYFGRPGYEEKKKELDVRPAKKGEYII
ncbi:MAG: glucose-6-phosphate isomerase [Defluviitaleaceae bacterium]|nr:glucose-6-phosphate isomerase [Defluviitaleaceae bacterium]